MKITASQLPYIAKCPCYKSKPTKATPAMLRGTNIDSCIRWWIANPEAPADVVASVIQPKHIGIDEIEKLAWSRDAILEAAEGSPVITQKSDCKIGFDLVDVRVTGELDALCPQKMSAFDVKSGQIRDYIPQMLPYAHALLLGNPSATSAHMYLCYTDQKKMSHLEMERSTVESALSGILLVWSDPNKKPTKNDYCAFCVHNGFGNKCNYAP